MTPKIIEKPLLPKEITTAQAAPQLLAQAVRVHLANRRQGTQSALTRAQVSRTRKKLYKQKGTGGARHGDRKAPIFVGGGIAFAPKPRDYSLKLAGNMRRLAILAALNQKIKAGRLFVADNLEKLTGKTKEAAAFLEEVAPKDKKTGQKILVITDQTRDNIFRALRNISAVTVLPSAMANTYEVLRADTIIMMTQAADMIINAGQEKNAAPVAIAKPAAAAKLSRVAPKPKPAVKITKSVKAPAKKAAARKK